MATKQATTTIEVNLATSRHGSLQPQIEFLVPRDTHHRRISALLHQVAAEVELRTPEHEKWCVEIEAHGMGGLVHLELLKATPAEAERGMKLLRTLANFLRGKGTNPLLAAPAKSAARSAPDDAKDATIARLAKEHLGFETLEERKSDGLDFKEVAVWSVKSALDAAYEAGKAGSR